MGRFCHHLQKLCAVGSVLGANQQHTRLSTNSSLGCLATSLRVCAEPTINGEHWSSVNNDLVKDCIGLVGIFKFRAIIKSVICQNVIRFEVQWD